MKSKLKLNKKIVAKLNDTDAQSVKGGGAWPDLSRLLCDTAMVRCSTVSCEQS